MTETLQGALGRLVPPMDLLCTPQASPHVFPVAAGFSNRHEGQQSWPTSLLASGAHDFIGGDFIGGDALEDLSAASHRRRVTLVRDPATIAPATSTHYAREIYRVA
jgi:hypothetical protein